MTVKFALQIITHESKASFNNRLFNHFTHLMSMIYKMGESNGINYGEANAEEIRANRKSQMKPMTLCNLKV